MAKVTPLKAMAPSRDSSGDVTSTPTGIGEFSNNDVIPPEHLGTGSPSSSTFLRGDGVWATGPGGSGSGVPHRGATVFRTSRFDITAGTGVVIPFDTAGLDTGGFYSSASASRLTIPNGVSRVQVTGQVYLSLTPESFASVSMGAPYGHSIIRILKNGQYVCDNRVIFVRGIMDGYAMGITSAVMDVVAGDYFELSVGAYFLNNYASTGYAYVSPLSAPGATYLSANALA